MRNVTFHSRDALDIPGATYIGLEDPRIRRIVERLPAFAPGQAVSRVRVADLPPEIVGYWSLWRVRVHGRWAPGDQLDERIMPFFLHEDGRVLPPTARHIWERLVSEGGIKECFPSSIAGSTLERMARLAEEHARPLYQELVQRHLVKLQRMREKGEYAFSVRRQAISRIGLAPVRARRLALLDEEIRQWREEMEQREAVCPEFSPLVVVHVG